MFIKPYRFFFISFILFILSSQVQCQRGDVRVMFYNLENLFDTINNPHTHDDEFLATGDKNWNNYRYWKKLRRTFQVIAAAGEEKPPEIIGFCEVESFLPLYNLCNNTPLSKFPYSIIHKDSPDRRGIDVAMIYRNDYAKLLLHKYVGVIFPFDSTKRTRDILAASFKVKEDTLDVIVNHWPSRMGGQAHSEPYRIFVANRVKSIVDSIMLERPNAKVIVTGDFNDEPYNKSLNVLSDSLLVNLSESLKEECNCGTYKYKAQWNMLDQVLVSRSLKEGSKLNLSKKSLHIYKADFLMETDKSYGGIKPYRTYLGPRYIGGYSDHLPVLIDLYLAD